MTSLNPNNFLQSNPSAAGGAQPRLEVPPPSAPAPTATIPPVAAAGTPTGKPQLSAGANPRAASSTDTPFIKMFRKLAQSNPDGAKRLAQGITKEMVELLKGLGIAGDPETLKQLGELAIQNEKNTIKLPGATLTVSPEVAKIFGMSGRIPIANKLAKLLEIPEDNAKPPSGGLVS